MFDGLQQQNQTVCVWVGLLTHVEVHHRVSSSKRLLK